jgi:NAD(P)-dependent dehydrogenase (short-subunit alcohol dehydrogenase family)
MSQQLLGGRVAVITGGASGIGRAIAERFAEHGARVVLGDVDADHGAAVAQVIGPAAVFRRADVTDEEQIAALVGTATSEFGRLDVMVNNAGASGNRAPIIDADADGFDQATRLLLRSVLLGHKYAARAFVAQGGGGSIISIGSIAGLEGGWGGVGYTASKHGVAGLVRAGAAQLGVHGIRSNAIHPGLVMTPIYARNMGVDLADAEQFLGVLGAELADRQPLGRTGLPGDIADAALFLASDLSAWITGVQLPVDGGYTAVSSVPFPALAAKALERFRAAHPVGPAS